MSASACRSSCPHRASKLQLERSLCVCPLASSLPSSFRTSEQHDRRSTSSLPILVSVQARKLYHVQCLVKQAKQGTQARRDSGSSCLEMVASSQRDRTEGQFLNGRVATLALSASTHISSRLGEVSDHLFLPPFQQCNTLCRSAYPHQGLAFSFGVPTRFRSLSLPFPQSSSLNDAVEVSCLRGMSSRSLGLVLEPQHGLTPPPLSPRIH